MLYVKSMWGAKVGLLELCKYAGCHKPKNEEKGKFIFKLAEKISTKIREKDYNMYINY